jgi:hypothetical protein
MQQMNSRLAVHTHIPGPAPGPSDAAAFMADATRAASRSAKPQTITR